MHLRYLIRVPNSQSHSPQDCSSLTPKVRKILEPYQADVGNLRISSLAVEFDLLLAKPEQKDHVLTRLSEDLGPITTERQLDIPVPPLSPKEVADEARRLVKEERFWECHETLEHVWRVSQGHERNVLQGVIQACAALVHAQKNEMDVAVYMVKLAVEKLGEKMDRYESLDIATLRRQLNSMLEEDRIVPFSL